MPVEQHIATTRLTDGCEVAYSTVGQGPFLVYAPAWLTHLELSWAMPLERRFYEALARGRTLLRYDRPGCGLSSPSSEPYSMRLELEVLRAVTRAAGASQFDLVGTSLGAPVAASWAASYPRTVTRLLLYGGWVRGQEVASADLQEHVLGLVSRHWGLGSDVMADIFATGADAATRAAYTRYQREASSAQTARGLLALCYQIDVTDVLPMIEAPALVLHRDRDRAVPLSQGRELAELIPGATFELMSGRAHLPFVGDVDALARAISRFLGLAPLRRNIEPSLTSRQREVAALVAQGLTNREIAARLVITERSAESHIERICQRMGFRSRSQIAAWHVASEGRE
jgi:pimeloyl-ACP methyl ester carboxylesterase/DNA-binding CsgD family transcriptional regulator